MCADTCEERKVVMKDRVLCYPHLDFRMIHAYMGRVNMSAKRIQADVKCRL